MKKGLSTIQRIDERPSYLEYLEAHLANKMTTF